MGAIMGARPGSGMHGFVFTPCRLFMNLNSRSEAKGGDDSANMFGPARAKRDKRAASGYSSHRKAAMTQPDMKSVIRALCLERHPVAGWHGLHYGDEPGAGSGRVSSSYFLLPGDEILPLQKLTRIEIWHYYLGAPAEMLFEGPRHMRERRIMGNDMTAGQYFQTAVPALFSRTLRSMGEWTLLGCTMSPGQSVRSGTLPGIDD